MIQYDDGAVVFECDSCSEWLNTEQEEFVDAVAVMIRDGWSSRKVGKDWTHTCPDCLRKETRRNFGL